MEFSLTWIWLIWHLAFPMPWDRSDSTFHYPFEKIYKEPLGTLKARRENWEKGNYSPLLLELMLESASLCPLKHFCVLPKLAFCLWACYREMEDWSGGGPSGDSVSPICRHADRGCIHCNLWFYINRNIFSYPIMCIWMNIWSMDDFKCLYVIDYIW